MYIFISTRYRISIASSAHITIVSQALWTPSISTSYAYDTHRFPLDDGGECSVLDHFRKQHGKKLQYPDLPCLHVGQKERHVYVPLEYLKLVPGQRCVKKLSEQQTSQMIKAVAKPAYQREREILKKVCMSLMLDYYTMLHGPIFMLCCVVVS